MSAPANFTCPGCGSTTPGVHIWAGIGHCPESYRTQQWQLANTVTEVLERMDRRLERIERHLCGGVR